MAGLIVTINGEPLASVSDAGLNLIAVSVHGDVIAEEASTIEVRGGLYGQGDADTHLVWANGHEISSDDDVEIEFAPGRYCFGNLDTNGKKL